jgi:hypothetical protein
MTVIGLGAGHASYGETLTGLVITTFKCRALLNDSRGAGYLERKWSGPFRKAGTWSLSLGRTLIPKLKSGTELRVGLDVSPSLGILRGKRPAHEINEILQD